ncbi:hypothetical protein OKW98_17630 [Pseudomonas sp. KU26590]|uniref:hypothetical protein n=1 Tax=Pseudomonas sp. KU26590 TaxID=2991051 RepID=UPI00223CEB13|nr:hypothetical protein [Pseudomonas sp. KU26590]UZJ58411.1 hypothetical protein OKW98_17630 [Pseudomonas sp. KU26590]
MEVRGWSRAVLGREGRVEEVVPRAEPDSASADGERRCQEPTDEPLSRVEQNLSWLPVYQEPSPFSLPLPGWPLHWKEDAALHRRYLAYVNNAERIGWQSLAEADRQAGRELASQLSSRAIDLASAKATEQLAENYWFFQAAAVASLFADGPESEAFARYSRDAESYRGWRRVSGQVQLFDEYVSVIASGAQLRPGTREFGAPSATCAIDRGGAPPCSRKRCVSRYVRFSTIAFASKPAPTDCLSADNCVRCQNPL